MFCIKCGGQIPNGVLVCPNCGTPVTNAVENVQQPSPQVGYVQMPQKIAPYCIAGLVCSCLGLVTLLLPFVNLALSIAGTSLCKKSSKAIAGNPQAFSGGSIASVGHVLGVLGIVINSIVVFIAVIWALCFGGELFFLSNLL